MTAGRNDERSSLRNWRIFVLFVRVGMGFVWAHLMDTPIFVITFSFYYFLFWRAWSRKHFAWWLWLNILSKPCTNVYLFIFFKSPSKTALYCVPMPQYGPNVGGNLPYIIHEKVAQIAVIRFKPSTPNRHKNMHFRWIFWGGERNGGMSFYSLKRCLE